MTEHFDRVFLSHLGGVKNNNLINTIDLDNNELQVIKHSAYYNIHHFKILVAEKNKHFSVLSLNIQSVNAKIDELSAFVSSLQDIHYKFNVICLQECWISNLTDLSNIQLPGYDRIAQGKSSSKNGGLITYVDNRFQYEVQLNINMYEYWEG